MGIMMVTSLNTYAKNMELAARWQKRQAQGNYAPDEPESVDHSFQNKVEEDNPLPERSGQMEMDIEIKLNAGKELSAMEMVYLKAYDPATYQKAKTISQERKAYEKALESCQTKDEVEQLKARYAAAAVERIRTIRKTPGLSREKKRELLKMEHMKAAALDDGMHEFIDSRKYKMLPAGAEDPEGENMEGTGKIGLPFVLEPLLDQKTSQDKAAKEAGEYEPIEKDTYQEKKAAEELSADDAAEEGSIMKALLDEEAGWASEEEENAGAGNAAEETFTSSQIKQAKAAYFTARTYPFNERSAKIDVKK